MTRDFDVVVIGSGIGGLICADTLAAKGKKVAVFEHHYMPGGYCSSFQRDGYTFDTVVDSIGGLDPKGVLGGIIRRLDLAEKIEEMTIRLDPVRENFFGKTSIIVPGNLYGYKEELARRFPEHKEEISGFLDLCMKVFAEIRSKSMRAIYTGEVSPELAAARHQTWREFALPHVPKEVQDVLAERVCFLGLPPSKVSAVSMLSMLLNYFDGGAFRIKGGYQNLADLLADDIRGRGGEIRLKTPVEKILVRDGEAVGIRIAGGEEITAGHVVANCDARKALLEMVGRDLLPEAVVSKLENAEASLSFIVVHVALSSVPEGLFRASSIGYYPGGSVEKSYDYLDGRLQDEDLFIGFGLPTMDDASLAPAGKHIVSIHHPLPVDQFDDWRKHRDSIADRLLEKLERIFPDLRSSIEFRSIATPTTFERYTWNRAGVAYGWSATPDRWPTVAHIQEGLPERLFLAGHWSDYGGGTVSAAISGHEIAQLILKGWVHQARGKQHVK